ncbi:MAG: DUF3572 domain-containing protein [Sphingomonas sp.]|jgi:hypothetical protein
MRNATANHDATVLALGALGWTLGDIGRATRLLALTGLDAEQLRAGAQYPTTLVAVLDFLAAHEPDLIACAAALGVTPATLIKTRDQLESA